MMDKETDFDAFVIGSDEDARRIAELEREVRELRRANEILAAESGCPARELDAETIDAELLALSDRAPQPEQQAPRVMAEFRALGPLEAVVGGQLVGLGAPKQRALLALLVSRAGQPVTVDLMLEELWAGYPPPSATTSLQVYVANLRRVLEPDRVPRTPPSVLRTRGRGYLLDSRVVKIDVDRFSEHATTGWQAWDRGDSRRALSEFEAGLALWRGEAYAEVADAACVVPEVARLEELRLSVVEGRCAALLAVGAHEMAAAELEAFMQAHPLREYGCELLSLALYRAGRQADALAALRTNQKRLADELGIDPRPTLQRLERDILNQDPALDWCSTPAVAAVTVPGKPTAPPQVRVTGALPGPGAAGPAAHPPAAHPPAAHPRAAHPPAAEEEVFAGRAAELRQLTEALAAAAAGRGRVVTVSGEPGSGKTSLLRHFGNQAGVPVLWATCPEHVAAPQLWPWEKVLRGVGISCPRHLAPGPVAELIDGDAQLPDGEDMTAPTLRRFEAIVHYLIDASRITPLVVVLDQLHRADQSSLRLLAHLAESVPASRLLVVVSYTPGEATILTETSAALARAGMTRIELEGLDIEETRALANALLGTEVGESTAEGLWARTEGNPFFLRELIKLLSCERHLEEPERAPVPAPVRDVVLQRVAKLPPAATELLSVAAIAGRHFDIDVVAKAASIEIETALEVIYAAVAAGLIAEDHERLGWFRFTHALTAEALYESTGRLRRARLYRRIGTAA